ncbi:type II 3-dehydroquinate dehydratase [Bacteriovorax sp. PP10]|uniref:3-dehydroquinate dehydratase n=1 Tax=Bacteriovorax antarcticus TaxID=3088717 RepID=A0ABU5VNN1_9BACT|nr:type II 3-dehydroquinate dehydratase [Bacteriovorax sp. PP10]MEA9354655.1 type II 3-dehydroquinate dehydratase [Bacteriovorax sp. PP10]
MNKTDFLIINGPNLNMLGTREPEVYGSLTLAEIQTFTEKSLEKDNVNLEWYQSNIEGEIVTKIQEATKKNYKALIINPGAYAHTSVAIYDALAMVKCPVIEVHISNTHRREDFRQIKLTAKASTIIMEGLGKIAYLTAVKTQLF